ncbi:MAG: hypothetical protein HKN22_08915 [Bacteroidia bacterium]|nr:hypothetical protein [Bacteroidia bacterium]
MTADVRKLAAIMFTDMVGYSFLAQSNESLSLELLEKHREILRPYFPKYSGTEVKTIGDAFMVEFKSALDAVHCGIAIQEGLQEYNQSCELNKNIQLRIGIHVGDVIVRDDDIYGDGVNISSRIEPLAEPGCICISEDVARQVQNKIENPLHKMGKHELKNIHLPMEVFQIKFDKPSSGNHNGEEQLENNKLAVLPFDNYSPEQETDYFSDGLTEELIMHLSRIKELKVVSRTTSMQYKNAKESLVDIGKKLNARYILEGSVRRQREDLRITAQLIDVETDSHLWAETYGGNMADVFDIQENVSKQIVQALRLQLTPEEQVALSKRATLNTEAFDLNLHGRGFLYRLTKSYLLASIDLFQQSISLDPRYAAAYAGLSEACGFLYQFFDKKPMWLDKAMEASLKAIMYDNNSSEAYSALGLVYFQKNMIQESLENIERAIELDEDNFFAYWIKGRSFHVIGRDKEAAQQYEKVLELNPDFHSVYGDLRMTYTALGEHDKASAIVQRSLDFYPSYLLRFPDDARAHIYYALNLQCVDRLEEAKNKMQRAMELSPHEAIVMYNAACFYSMIGDKETAIQSLQQAVENGYEDFGYIAQDYDFKNIREEEGFKKILAMGKENPTH